MNDETLESGGMELDVEPVISSVPSSTTQKFLDYEGLKRVVQHINSSSGGSYVPVSRKINGYTLANDVTLTAADVSAISQEELDEAIQAAIIDSWSTEI